MNQWCIYKRVILCREGKGVEEMDGVCARGEGERGTTQSWTKEEGLTMAIY